MRKPFEPFRAKSAVKVAILVVYNWFTYAIFNCVKVGISTGHTGKPRAGGHKVTRKKRVRGVIFKLDDPYLEQLEKAAAALDMRPNLYARRLVVQSLMNIQLERMEYRLDLMQEGMAAGFEKVLTQLLLARNEIGMVGEEDERSEREQQEDTEEKARAASEWVKEHVLLYAEDQ